MSDDNGSIKLVDIPNRGRSFISSRPLNAGEIVLRDTPILLYSAVHGGSAAVYCSHCFRTIPPHSPTSVSCPNCAKDSTFCSSQCLSTAQSTSHTPFVCRALTQLHNSQLQNQSHERVIQARYLVAAYNLALVSPSDFRTLLSLQGDPVIDEVAVFLHSLVSSICNVSQFNIEMTASLLAKDRINAFGIMESIVEGKERSVRAYGIYPRASFFNHDCLPNACRFDYVDSIGDGIGTNVDIVVRIIHDVPEGREICLSYFPVNLKYTERQKRLKEDYGFTCDCDRCKVESNWSDDDDDEGEMDQDNDEDMDEDDDDNNGDDMGDDGIENDECEMEKENDDFPHAYFFVRYMCGRDNCGGTLAPLAPVNGRSSNVFECNVCGNLSKCEEDADEK